MTRAEKVELALLAAVVGGVWLLSADLRWAPAIGTLLGYSAALLLAQGLVRDVVKLVARRVASGNRQRIVCLCAESSIGAVLLLLGISLTLLGLTQTVSVTRIGLVGGVATVLALGFVAKDFVITIRREKDHARIIPW